MTFVWITSYLFVFVLGCISTFAYLMLSAPKAKTLDDAMVDAVELEELAQDLEGRQFVPTILSN
jgi:hypothetical protein